MQVLFSLKHETKTTWWQCFVLVLINWYFVNSICSYIMIECVLCANCFEFEKGKSNFLGLGFCIVSFWLFPLPLERILSDSLVFLFGGFLHSIILIVSPTFGKILSYWLEFPFGVKGDVRTAFNGKCTMFPMGDLIAM